MSDILSFRFVNKKFVTIKSCISRVVKAMNISPSLDVNSMDDSICNVLFAADGQSEI